MDLVAQVVDINLWAVLVAAAAAYVGGAIWYSQSVFGKAWRKMVVASTRVKDKDLMQPSAPMLIGQGFAQLIMAYVLAYLMGLLGAENWIEGVVVAGWIALGFVVTMSLADALWKGTRKKLWAVETGYAVLSLLLMGAILGAWQ
ncbi:DUF1761 domain-containing protein [Candidatus Microgenomates bacterium]|nr:DUF1761 domain-containing protein [Candidatus Microgenomates bacterium]